jgi:putative ATP-dependent endonuclease of OLD family
MLLKSGERKFIELKYIEVKNYRSFDSEGIKIHFPEYDYQKAEGKPISIVGYNNAGKTNLISSILFGIGYKWVQESTFELKDFHCSSLKNRPLIITQLDGHSFVKNSGYDDGLRNSKNFEGKYTVSVEINESEISPSAKVEPSFFGKLKNYGVYYINFHEIKKEASTKKTSWGNLSSFLAKYIKKITDTDKKLIEGKQSFEQKLKDASDEIKKESGLNTFIHRVKDKLSENLRTSSCDIEFGLPDYEDIFLEMIFKVGLNDDSVKVPLDHLGDGYLSMFVISIIESIADDQSEGGNLFVFEEPETFLHENHQEYFYNKVLCKLARRNQVIYTTHSKKMVDIFSPETIIRLHHDGKATRMAKQIMKDRFKPELPSEFFDDNGSSFLEPYDLDKYKDFSKFIHSIEPNLGKLIFSDKVVLIEGPMDLLAYSEAINNITQDENFLSCKNIAILPHHGKDTSAILIQLCNSFEIDYYVIHDWDIADKAIDLNSYDSSNTLLKGRDKCQMTKNKKIYDLVKNKQNIHFNQPKLEGVLGFELKKDSELEYKRKNTMELWAKLKKFSSNNNQYPVEFFPVSLRTFLGITKMSNMVSL